jgi:aldose 1-epimerase
MNHPNIAVFGTLPDGTPIHTITLKSEMISCQVITFGAALQALFVPDREGTPTDIVLGYDSAGQYLSEKGYFGATVGRVANRIAYGNFELNGIQYTLPINNGNHHLHGGVPGLSHRVWDIDAVTDNSVTLSITATDGEQGYPGNLKVTATYTLDGNRLILRHTAVCDADTLCSLTNHSYFNLSGHDSGSAMDQKLRLFSEEFTPSDPEAIPYGRIEPVAGTPMDFSELHPIGLHIAEDYPQLVQGKGYDHNYVVSGQIGVLRPAALAVSDVTGIAMAVDTTMPGVQLYTANYVPENLKGKGGSLYGPRHGFCLETQYYPDAIHHPNFPSPLLKAGSMYRHETSFRFLASK